MITPILPNMIPLENIKDISEGDRLFYELGYKIHWDKPNSEWNWIRTGRFKEIEDVKHMIENDEFLIESDIKYIKHHNFMLIKLTNN